MRRQERIQPPPRRSRPAARPAPAGPQRGRSLHRLTFAELAVSITVALVSGAFIYLLTREVVVSVFAVLILVGIPMWRHMRAIGRAR